MGKPVKRESMTEFPPARPLPPGYTSSDKQYPTTETKTTPPKNKTRQAGETQSPASVADAVTLRSTATRATSLISTASTYQSRSTTQGCTEVSDRTEKQIEQSTRPTDPVFSDATKSPASDSRLNIERAASLQQM